MKLISYSCDGTEIERALERAFIAVATSAEDFLIPHPKPGEDPLIFKIYFYDGHPIVVLQDSKHGLKTVRNNLFSGARFLVIGNYPAYYEQIRVLAHDPRGPLYIRDVDNADKQDDRAAVRLTSAASLEFLIDQEEQHYKESNTRDSGAPPFLSRLGVITYLFIFGELIDAYQNRRIGWSTRLLMVLRAKFFVEMWKSFLGAAGYAQGRHFISREADDIVNYLINGLVGLMIIHRDYLDDDSYPLLPWLHSSEPCEHSFGCARTIVPDFTHADFLHMVPKIGVFHKATINADTSADANKTASGYHITCHDHRGINLALLSSFPNDPEIAQISKAAYNEAEALWIVLGVPPLTMDDPSLPDRLINWADEDSDEELESFADAAENPDGPSIDDIVAEAEERMTSSESTREDRAQLEAYATAAVALDADDVCRVYVALSLISE